MYITSRTTTIGRTPYESTTEKKPTLAEMKEDLKAQEQQLKDLLNNIPTQLNRVNGVAASRSGIGENLDVLV